MSNNLNFAITVLGMAALTWLGSRGTDTSWALVALATSHGAAIVFSGKGAADPKP